jgi:hypothetical protein
MHFAASYDLVRDRIIVPKLVTCAAILCVRNEAACIAQTLKSYIEQGIDVVVIDHDSTDKTRAICKEQLGRGVLRIEHLPWAGVFDLSSQLAAKAAIVDSLPHEWVIHGDADEWLQSPVAGESLLEGISRVSAAGNIVVNFEEFVFVPTCDSAAGQDNYQQTILNYYYFAPAPQRLMRAWRRTAELSNWASGGHRLKGSAVRLAPDSFILRHYIALSSEHAIRKYVGRRFSEADLKKGWHRKRLNLSPDDLALPSPASLKRLPQSDSKQFDRSDPKMTHFWEWNRR